MKTNKLIFTTLFSVIYFGTINAQQQLGQIVIGAGYGYSPEFDGEMCPYYSIYTSASGINGGLTPYPVATFSSITYNKGATLDVGIMDGFSVGVAASYQSEKVTWEFGSDGGPPPPYQFYDDINRTNFALRLFHHSQSNKHIDFYYGTRLGISIWRDSPSPLNISYYGNPTGVGTRVTFLFQTPNITVLSFQVLCGLRYFPLPFLGLQVEAGIGSPYLAEAGLTIRIGKTDIDPAPKSEKFHYITE